MPVVRFQPRGTSIEVPRGTLLIEAIRRAGLPIANPCGEDLICAKCSVHILEGDVPGEAGVEREAKRRNRVAPRQRLSCAIRVRSDLVVSADYWGGSR